MSTWRQHSFSNVILRKTAPWRELPFSWIWYTAKPTNGNVYDASVRKYRIGIQQMQDLSCLLVMCCINVIDPKPRSLSCSSAGKWPYYWTYYHPSYCAYNCWVFGLWMWEARSCHPYRYEFLCWRSSWGNENITPFRTVAVYLCVGNNKRHVFYMIVSAFFFSCKKGCSTIACRYSYIFSKMIGGAIVKKDKLKVLLFFQFSFLIVSPDCWEHYCTAVYVTMFITPAGVCC